MNEADLLIVLGASFANHTGIYPGHPIIHVDIEPMQLGKFHPVEVPVWGEIGVTARLVATVLDGAELAAPIKRPTSPSARRSGTPRSAAGRRRPRRRRRLGGGLRGAHAVTPTTP